MTTESVEVVKAKLPSRTISFKIEDSDNDYKVNYPNTGQFIQIQSNIQSMTRNTYDSLGGTISSQLARYTTDMIAFFSVCCPDLKKDLKVETFSDLEMIDSKKLLKVYIEVILPWLIEWETILNADEQKV